jgi:tetratricopeptide (TPR) repeat protein
MKKTITLFTVIAVFLAALFSATSARADVAPPEAPPGSNLVPGSESTQVRMMAETVILTVSADPADKEGAIARTDATFTMRNLGSAEEKMSARFPLTFFNGNSDGFGRFPEIPGITVKVNGQTVPTRREMQPFLASESSYKETDQIPWAVFDVTFPPAQDVTIEVAYTVNGYGYYPYEVFKYVLETGAGWNGSIGVVDVIVRFPYDVNEKNVWMNEADYAGYGDPISGGVLSGKEVRWHFEDLEPTREDNIQVLLVAPSLWESVLKETGTVTKNPNDGEAWGRLGKAYKEIVRMSKGYLREDPVGLEMFQLSREAYEKCLALLPNDPVWHYGYADLLWSKYYFELYGPGKSDPEGILPLILSHLQTALKIAPNTQQARDLLTEISYSVPDAVQLDGNDFIYLGLTATPIHPTPWVYPTETAFPTLTEPAAPTATLASVPSAESVPPTETPTARNPLCGSAALVLPALAGVFWISRRKRS